MAHSAWESQRVTVSGDGDAVVVSTDHCRIITEHLDRMTCVPYLTYLAERDRLLMLLSGGDPSQPMVMSSDDHGETWSDPRSVVIGKGEARHWLGLALTCLGGDRLVMSLSVFPCTTEGRYRSTSEDGGVTWSQPMPIAPTSTGEVWNPWDPWLVDHDEGTSTVIRVAETGYISTNDAPHGGHSQALIRFSNDAGLTWSKEIRPSQWDGVNEVHLCRASNGTLVAACRLNPPKQYWHEIDHYEGLGVSRSRDNGKTWSDIEVLYAWGRHHPSMVCLPSGVLVMSYVVRKGYPETTDGFPQFGVEAVVSRDHGASWDLQHRIILAQWRGNTKGEDPELERQFRARWPRWWASSQATSTALLADGNTLVTAFGTGYRSDPGENGVYEPRDIGVAQWQV